MSKSNLKPKNNFTQQLKWANSLNNSNLISNNSLSNSNNNNNNSIFTPFIENNN
eukprot:jgi/Orpsp1_1/1178053/evm.model.c7180000063851.2